MAKPADNRKQDKRRLSLRGLLLKACALALALLFVYMLVQADTVRVVRTDVPVVGLDPAFDGIKILYVSDLHIASGGELAKTLALFDELQAVHPDVLVLGGDYTAENPMGLLASRGADARSSPRQAELSRRFFEGLASFNATYGKFAVAGDQDNGAAVPLESFVPAGRVTLLRDHAVVLTKASHKLVLAGLDDWRTGGQTLSRVFDGCDAKDTVILVSHTPEALPPLFLNDPSASPVCDVALTGHTMGGRVALFGRELFNPLGERDYPAGWQIMGMNTQCLISRGLNCNWPPLRLGTRPEVHVLTLRAVS